MIYLLQFRHATLSDLEAITALEAVCFPEAEACQKESFQKRLQIFQNHFILLEKDNQIIGMINGMVTDQRTITDDLYEKAEKHNPDGKYQSIFGLEVHPDYQHYGYAKQLMDAMIKQAKHENRSGCILTCKAHLISFYEQFGYENLGVSASTHGNACWYDMFLNFKKKAV